MQHAHLKVDGVTIRVPAGSMDPPTEYGKTAVKCIQNPGNWKLPTDRFVTDDIGLANEVGYALDWFMGGHEIEVTIVNGVPQFTVWSKGYYHHIGS